MKMREQQRRSRSCRLVAEEVFPGRGLLTKVRRLPTGRLRVLRRRIESIRVPKPRTGVAAEISPLIVAPPTAVREVRATLESVDAKRTETRDELPPRHRD